MPVIVKLPSGNWRAQVRRKGKYISNTFRRRADADTWALDTERNIDKGFYPKAIIPSSVKTFGEIIDLRVQDMLEVGKKSGDPKTRCLNRSSLNSGAINCLK
jgi:hypothetical protein